MILTVIDAYARNFRWTNALLLLFFVNDLHDLLLSFLFRSAPPNFIQPLVLKQTAVLWKGNETEPGYPIDVMKETREGEEDSPDYYVCLEEAFDLTPICRTDFIEV